MSNSTIIDDTSPDVFYTGDWTPLGSSQEFNSTTHGTSDEGAQAIFTFNGSLVEVFGTIGRKNNESENSPPTSSYTIDNNSSGTVDFTGKIGTSILYQQLFFSSQGLAEGQHTLVVSCKIPGKNPFWLDYFRVTHSLSASTSTSNSTPTSTPTPTPTPSPSSISTGAIVGIAVGACAALALLISIVFLLRSLLRRPPPYSYTNQESTSWLQRLVARLEPRPPGELHPFDPYARASPYSHSAHSFPYPTRSSSSVPGLSRPGSRGMDAVYHHEVARHSNRGRLEEKRSRPSNMTNVLNAESPLPQ